MAAILLVWESCLCEQVDQSPDLAASSAPATNALRLVTHDPIFTRHAYGGYHMQESSFETSKPVAAKADGQADQKCTNSSCLLRLTVV